MSATDLSFTALALDLEARHAQRGDSPPTPAERIIEEHRPHIERAVIGEHAAKVHARAAIREATRRAESIRIFGHPGASISNDSVDAALRAAAEPEDTGT